MRPPLRAQNGPHRGLMGEPALHGRVVYDVHSTRTNLRTNT